MLLLALAIVRSESEHILGMSSLAFGMILIAAGAVAYAASLLLKPAGLNLPVQETPEPAA